MSVSAATPARSLVLDRYRAIRPLGHGGSGSVWLACDEQTGLDVALKIVPREGKRAARATREMEAASRLRHVRCVRAYRFGEDHGHVYISYEYVRGRTMRERIRSGELRSRDAVEAAAQVLDALAHAHGQGIVHRDVKPSNVMLEDGPAVSVKLLDFGLAQFGDGDTLTNVGDVPGTLAYIAPERLAGSDATTRSDVWSVGVLLWEALVGDHPFWGVPLQQVAATIAAGAPPLAEKRPDLPRGVTEAVDAALDLDPARRPSADELAARLRVALEPRRRSPARTSRSRGRTQRVGGRSRAVGARGLRPGVNRRIDAGSITGVATATTATAIGATLLPFWPVPLVLALAALGGVAALVRPRAALAIVLFAPVFPLGNLARGAALAYLALALLGLLVAWRAPAVGVAVAVAPLLGAAMLARAPAGTDSLTVAFGAAREALVGHPAAILAALAFVGATVALARRRPDRPIAGAALAVGPSVALVALMLGW